MHILSILRYIFFKELYRTVCKFSLYMFIMCYHPFVLLYLFIYLFIIIYFRRIWRTNRTDAGSRIDIARNEKQELNSRQALSRYGTQRRKKNVEDRILTFRDICESLYIYTDTYTHTCTHAHIHTYKLSHLPNESNSPIRDWIWNFSYYMSSLCPPPSFQR